MGVFDYVEYGLGSILRPVRAHDAKLFTNTAPALANFPSPTFTIDSPDCGPSGSSLKIQHTAYGDPKNGELQGQFPALSWEKPFPNVQEYVLLVEDVDIPLPFVALHGLYYGIAGDTTQITQADVEVEDVKAKPRRLKGVMKLGKSIDGSVYVWPRPPFGHGPHRYVFTLIALSEKVDRAKVSVVATKEELAREIEGKVLGFGVWIGVYERKWE